MRTPALLALMAAIVGCAAPEARYEDATLEDVLTHRTPNREERYRIDRPTIPVVRQNTGVIRQGSMFAILVGPDLKDVVQRWPTNVRYGVRLEREPRIHLVLERVFTTEDEIDLLGGQEGFRYHFPLLGDADDVPLGEYQPRPIGDVGTTGELVQLTDVPLTFAVPGEPQQAWMRDRAETGRADRSRYFVGPDEARFLVTTSDPMTLLMLDFLRSERRGFSGGVRVAALVPEKERVRAGLRGTLEVRWIQLGSAMYYRAP